MADPRPPEPLVDDNPRPAPMPQPEPGNVRERNLAIRENAEDRVGLFVSKFIYWFRVAMFSALLLEIIIVLSLKWSESVCSQPLRTFLVVFAVNSTLILTTNIFYFKSLITGMPIPEEDTFLSKFMSSLHRTTELMDQLIMIFGFLIVSQPGDCKKVAPVLFAVSLQIVTLRFAIWILPFFLLTFVFCCFGTFLMLASKYKKWKDKQKVMEMLDQVPRYKYQPSQTAYGDAVIETSAADCAICLAPYEDGAYLRILECKHHYHQECIDQWLCLTPSCPLCKREVLRRSNSDSNV